MALPVLEPGDHPLVGHLGIIHHRRFDAPEIDGAAVALFGDIAHGSLQDAQKGLLQVLAAEFLAQLQGPGGVLDHLLGFQTRDVGEKPAATGIHQQGVALHFQEFQGRHPIALLEAGYSLVGRNIPPATGGCGPESPGCRHSGQPRGLVNISVPPFRKSGPGARLKNRRPPAGACASAGSSRVGRRWSSRSFPSSAPLRGRSSRNCLRLRVPGRVQPPGRAGPSPKKRRNW